MLDKRLSDLIDRAVAADPDALALISPGRKSLNYRQLQQVIREFAAWAKQHGLKADCRIAALLPDNFDALAAFWAVCNAAVFVPLNPESTAAELKFQLKYFRIEALLVPENSLANYQSVARKLGLSLIGWNFAQDLQLRLVHRGWRWLINLWKGAAQEANALILCTSGTTDRPKIIPRSHHSLLVIGENVARAYRLSNSDRLLLMTPVHFAAAITSTIASAYTAANIVVTNQLDAAGIGKVFTTFAPTWFGASPTVFQAIATEAERNQAVFHNPALRFLRSTGAVLPAPLIQRLQSIFKVPIVNTYGLTEAGIMACDYGVPQREGSVGMVVAGCETRVMDEDGTLVADGVSGEIVARGSSVLDGYENNPSLNREAFREGWFRTGDYGYIDNEGYLFITGRIKELINRGGHKVSPYEVEAWVRQHPDLLDVVVFPYPNPRLGEEIAAALVLKGPAVMTVSKLCAFLDGKLSHSKIPSKLFIVKEIPVGPAGKIQRNTLHQLLKDAVTVKDSGSGNRNLADYNATELKLLQIWQELLGAGEIDRQDNFFELGGDSLLLEQLYAVVEQTWGHRMDLSQFYQQATIAGLARLLDPDRTSKNTPPFIVPIQAQGTKIPIYFIHPLRGGVIGYHPLVKPLGADQPVYGVEFQLNELPLTLNLKQLVAYYIRSLQQFQPSGPYLLAGYSLGGLIAYEIARELTELGHEVALLAMLDTELFSNQQAQLRRLKWLLSPKRLKLNYRKCLMAWERNGYWGMKNRLIQGVSDWLQAKEASTSRDFLAGLIYQYQPRAFKGEILYFKAAENEAGDQVIARWRELASAIEVVQVPANHMTILNEPAVSEIARAIRQYLQPRATRG